MKHLNLTDTEMRTQIRCNMLTGNTSGLCPGYLQVNLVILPSALAAEFTDYCVLNPKPCPLVAVSKPGSVTLPHLGEGLDLRTDLPGYAVYKDGVLSECVTDIMQLWQNDFVSFALGCSFTFEAALLAAGVRMRHIEVNRTVPMYITDIDTVPTENFAGKLVVSMRPVPRHQLSVVDDICINYPHAHGLPVHSGTPDAIGIADLSCPDWGDSVKIEPDEIPVFWACGVTSQVAIQSAHLPLAITHKPGSMLITKINSETSLPVFGQDWQG